MLWRSCHRPVRPNSSIDGWSITARSPCAFMSTAATSTSTRLWCARWAARSADQLLGRKIADFIHPDSLAAVRGQIAARQRDGDTTPPLELAIVTLDGGTREVEALAIRTRWEGRPAHKVVFRDVSTAEGHRSEPALPGGSGGSRQRRHHLHHHVRLRDQLESRGRGDLSAAGSRGAGAADRRGHRYRPRSGGHRGRRGSGTHHPPRRRRLGAGGAGLGVPDGRRIRCVMRESDGSAAR